MIKRYMIQRLFMTFLPIILMLAIMSIPLAFGAAPREDNDECHNLVVCSIDGGNDDKTIEP
jgi:hypothetical protein